MEAFIEEHGRPPVVLDIGCGTGLLSMLAATSGAEEVYGCELYEPLAQIAREVTQLNCKDKIKVFLRYPKLFFLLCFVVVVCFHFHVIWPYDRYHVDKMCFALLAHSSLLRCIVPYLAVLCITRNRAYLITQIHPPFVC